MRGGLSKSNGLRKSLANWIGAKRAPRAGVTAESLPNSSSMRSAAAMAGELGAKAALSLAIEGMPRDPAKPTTRTTIAMAIQG